MSEASERLREARIAAGFERPADAAARHGWNVNTYKSNENGNAPFSFAKAKVYAKAFGVRPEWLYDSAGEQNEPAKPTKAHVAEAGPAVDLAELRSFIAPARSLAGQKRALQLRPISRQIPVVGDVAAGIWRETVVRELSDVEEFLPIDVPGYERAQLTALRVEGPSMDMVYPPGRYVVVAHPSEAGLRVGDYVVVQRQKADVFEITLKEFVQDPDGRIALWPRSYHPDFQTPVYLVDGGEQDQTGPTIIGVVVADYAKRVRPPIVFKPSGD